MWREFAILAEYRIYLFWKREVRKFTAQLILRGQRDGGTGEGEGGGGEEEGKGIKIARSA